MSVSVLVPWRGGDQHREHAWTWVRKWWRRTHPGWQIVQGCCPDGPWVKAHAIADALSRADGDLLVVADADVICAEVGQAVDAVAAGVPWAIPHGKVHRLSEQATATLVTGADPTTIRGGLSRKPYRGVEGGGLVVLPRRAYDRVPLDPRFVGWGQEDESWGLALSTLAGKCWRGTAPLWHLHHPPAERLNQHVGSADGWALHVRYRYAAKHPPTMTRLVGEARTIADGGAVWR